jgi:hypothetical protein
VARTRLIVGLITPHRIYLPITKPVREAKAVLCYVCMSCIARKVLMVDLSAFELSGTFITHREIKNV